MKEKNPAPKVIPITKHQRVTILRWMKKGAINVRELFFLVIDERISNMTDEELDTYNRNYDCIFHEEYCEWALKNGLCQRLCQDKGLDYPSTR